MKITRKELQSIIAKKINESNQINEGPLSWLKGIADLFTNASIEGLQNQSKTGVSSSKEWAMGPVHIEEMLKVGGITNKYELPSEKDVQSQILDNKENFEKANIKDENQKWVITYYSILTQKNSKVESITKNYISDITNLAKLSKEKINPKDIKKAIMVIKLCQDQYLLEDIEGNLSGRIKSDKRIPGLSDQAIKKIHDLSGAKNLKLSPMIGLESLEKILNHFNKLDGRDGDGDQTKKNERTIIMTKGELRSLISEEITMHNIYSQNTDPIDLISSINDRVRVITLVDNSSKDKPVVVICQKLKDKYKSVKSIPQEEYENAWDDVFENRYQSEEDAMHDLRQAAMQIQRQSFAENPVFSSGEEF